MLPSQIDDVPPTIPLLDVRESERRHLGSPKAAAKQDGQDRAIPQPLNGRDVGRAEESLRLAKR